MNLREYIEGLNKFAKENPETLDMLVITSKDDEGNEYNPVFFGPCKGIFEDSDFTTTADYGSEERHEDETNAVCVN